MSDDKTLEQNVWLRIDLEAAKKHLSHLREKAFRHGSLIVQYGTLLRDTPERLDGASEPDANEPDSRSSDFFECQDHQKMLELADEIRNASRLVLDLQTRLSCL